MLDHFFPLLFPKDSESLKILDIRLREVWAKRLLNGTSKVKKVRRKKLCLCGDFRLFSNKIVHIWDHFFPLLFPKDSKSLKILDIRLWEVGAKRPENSTSKVKKVRRKRLCLRADFRQLLNTNVHIWDHLFPLLFPKESESLKILDIRLWEVGATRLLNGTSKVNRHTDRRTDTRTDRQTDISTYRKHRLRGPMLWKYIYIFSFFLRQLESNSAPKINFPNPNCLLPLYWNHVDVADKSIFKNLRFYKNFQIILTAPWTSWGELMSKHYFLFSNWLLNWMTAKLD